MANQNAGKFPPIAKISVTERKSSGRIQRRLWNCWFVC